MPAERETTTATETRIQVTLDHGTWETITDEQVAATPDQVWQAIATDAGLDGWFIGSSSIQPGQGGALRSIMGTFTDEFSITAWDPPHRVAYQSGPAEGGGFFALEWRVEGRAGGTMLRCVASGFLPGDNWEAEFESLKEGGAMYFLTLVQYLAHFTGRTALVIDALGPPVDDADQAWHLVTEALGLNRTVRVGDQVRLTPAGFAPIEGVVYAVGRNLLTVRSTDAIYRFLSVGPMSLVSHRLFAADLDRPAATQAWQGWLSRLFA